MPAMYIQSELGSQAYVIQQIKRSSLQVAKNALYSRGHPYLSWNFEGTELISKAQSTKTFISCPVSSWQQPGKYFSHSSSPIGKVETNLHL